MAKRVFLHIGAPKTGSTFVQNVLFQNRSALKRAGILLPGSASAHDQAMTDLREVTWRDPAATWTWDRLAAKAAGWHGDVVISNEALGGATPAQAARAVSSLAPAEVHIVVATRDLWRTFPSMWQQSIRSRNIWTFEAFLSAVEQGRFETFWEMHTGNRMLRRWGDLVPAAHRHLITVPPAGAPHGTLWQRFARVLGIPDGVCEIGEPTANTSLGAAETEVLRRVNQALGDRYPHRTPYQKVVQRHLVNAVLRKSGNTVPLRVGPDRAEWVLDLAEQQIKELAEYPCDIVGDLSELRPAGVREAPGPAPAELGDSQVLAAAIEAIIGMLGHAESLGDRVDHSYEQRFQRLTERATGKVKRTLRLRG
ncbi:hypothetical protein AB0M02_29210 [Actinoplanes sp. NPDC051861]|uniref:hypothetical protein n=1 Tax=Actinoplanes sp. NPDC051861 TaxID=3155170 RepID=UPI0034252ECE